jgi:hypothetical protein
MTRLRIRLAVSFCAVWVAVSAVAEPTAATKSFLWKASNRQGAIYLVGSVHMLTSDYYPLAPALDTAFKDSDLLVEEADLGEMLSSSVQFQLLSRGMLPSDQTLDKVISPATFALVSKRVDGLGLPFEALSRFKPWFLTMTLLALEWQKAGFAADLGLDKHFYDRAQAESKSVQGLETVEFQISRFDGLTMVQQERLLSQSLKDLDVEKANITKVADAWKTGDVPTIERIVLMGLKDDPVMYDRLLVERNRTWLPKLEAFFARPGRAFVVVGAAHLVGPDGLIAMLKAKGYQVVQM